MIPLSYWFAKQVGIGKQALGVVGLVMLLSACGGQSKQNAAASTTSPPQDNSVIRSAAAKVLASSGFVAEWTDPVSGAQSRLVFNNPGRLDESSGSTETVVYDGAIYVREGSVGPFSPVSGNADSASASYLKFLSDLQSADVTKTSGSVVSFEEQFTGQPTKTGTVSLTNGSIDSVKYVDSGKSVTYLLSSIGNPPQIEKPASVASSGTVPPTCPPGGSLVPPMTVCVSSSG